MSATRRLLAATTAALTLLPAAAVVAAPRNGLWTAQTADSTIKLLVERHRVVAVLVDAAPDAPTHPDVRCDRQLYALLGPFGGTNTSTPKRFALRSEDGLSIIGSFQKQRLVGGFELGLGRYPCVKAGQSFVATRTTR